MASSRYLIFHLLICLIFVTLSNAEIHRAKANVQKYAGLTLGAHKPSVYVADELDMSLETNMFDTKVGVWICSILGAMLVGLSGIFPLLVIPIETGPALKHGAAAARLKLLLSFAVGGLLGDVFLHLLPEAWEHLYNIDAGHDEHTRLGLWVITGMLSFLILEKMFAKEDEFEHLEDECAEAEEEEKLRYISDQCQSYKEQACSKKKNTDCIENNKTGATDINYSQHSQSRRADTLNMCTDSVYNKNTLNTSQNNISPESKKPSSGAIIIKDQSSKQASSSIKVSGYLNLAANVIDNFTHGLAVAGGFLVNSKVGFVTLFAILLHEIPHEVGDFAILLRSGFDRWKAAKAQVCTAASGVLGALTALTAHSAAGESTVWILPFTSGGFIYIALVTVVPDLLEERHPKESSKQILSLLAGVGAMYLVTYFH